jgi:hypothetical protein
MKIYAPCKRLYAEEKSGLRGSQISHLKLPRKTRYFGCPTIPVWGFLIYQNWSKPTRKTLTIDAKYQLQ